MKFIDTLLLLAAVAFGVMVPLFIGHALAAHENVWYAYGAGALVIAAVLSVVLARRLRPDGGGAY